MTQKLNGKIAVITGGKTGMPEAQLQQLAEGVVSGVPLGRMGQPDDVANAVLFLASDEASYVRGR